MEQQAASAADGRASICVVVLGMHRSGTSAVTRIANLLGVQLGDRLMAPASGNNETGFWEHQVVVDLHEAALANLGRGWDDPRPMPADMQGHPGISEISDRLVEALRRDFAGTSLWGVKDPRHCRLLPLWRRVFQELNAEPVFILVVRNPLDIARSLERRDGIPMRTGLLLWLRHMVEAERETRDRPRAVVHYDALLADWRKAMTGVDTALGLDWRSSFDAIADEVAGFLDPVLHHHATPAESVTSDPDLNRWVREVFAALMQSGPDAAAELPAVVDRVADELALADGLYEPALSQAWPLVAELRRRVVALEQNVMERDDRIRDREFRIAERDTRIADRDAAVAERDSRIAERDHLIGLRNARIDDMHALVRQKESEIARLAGEADLARLEVQQLRQSTSWLITAPFRYVGRAVKRGPSALGRRWWLNPLAWALAPLWIVFRGLRLLTRALSYLRWRTHRLTPTPMTGVRERGDGWFVIDGPAAVFAMSTDRQKPVRMPSLAIIESEVESADGLVRAWLTRAGAPSVDLATAVALPMRTGRHRFSARIQGPVDALWVEPTAFGEPCTLRLHTVRITEVGAFWILAEKLGRFTSTHGLSWSAWWGLFRRIAAGGLMNTARNALPNSGQTIGLQEYRAWIDGYDTLSESDLAAIRKRIEEMPHRPKLSLVMPTYNTPIKWLRRAIDSVRDQLYTDWEFCIADDASHDSEVREVLGEYARQDERIKVVFREQNGHISRASNSALELATGEYIVLVDHDDELPVHALYMVAEEINAHPEADVIYSDEDKIDEAGVRSAPYFKSRYNPDLFLSHNMISHLGVYRSDLVREVGGFRPEFDGSQDYDLALRVIDRTIPDRIRHIPHVLYHWRTIPGSVALSGDEKQYAHVKAREAIQAHLDRTGRSNARVEPTFNGKLHRVNYALPDPSPRVSVIVPTRNAKDLLRVAVESCIDRTDYPDFEILIVDNQSDEPDAVAYLEKISQSPRVRVLPYAKPFNFADMNNLAAAEATGSVLCFLNNDTEVIGRDWLAHMVSHAMRPEIGAVGAKLYFPDDTIQHAGIVLVPEFIAWHAFSRFPRDHSGFFGRAILQQNYSAVTAACMVVRRELFELVDGFDAQAFAVSYNDVDFCLRLGAKGFRTFWTPFAELYHYQSASLGKPRSDARVAQFEAEAATFRSRWAEIIDDDPCYSPNLTERIENFSLAFPPRTFKPWKHKRSTASGRAVQSGRKPAA